LPKSTQFTQKFLLGDVTESPALPPAPMALILLMPRLYMQV